MKKGFLDLYVSLTTIQQYLTISSISCFLFLYCNLFLGNKTKSLTKYIVLFF